MKLVSALILKDISHDYERHSNVAVFLSLTETVESKDRVLNLCSYNSLYFIILKFTAVVKNVVGKHYFLAVSGPIDAHFSSQPLWQPHGMTVSHIVKLNHTVIKKELGLG